ncbi:hypothetical protein ABH933_003529 [Nocardia sp. GP40]|uniref:hypothetical protein n=1 Tax=Nocardia sp. GP40 TaxID=3156268 RepID=UPI003D1AE0D7
MARPPDRGAPRLAVGAAHSVAAQEPADGRAVARTAAIAPAFLARDDPWRDRISA